MTHLTSKKPLSSNLSTESRERGRETAKKNRELRLALNIPPPPRQSVAVLRKAIKAKCYDCNGDEDAHNRTRFCDVPSCPLYPVRPFQQKEALT